MSPMLQMNVPGRGGASIQPRGDFTCSPPTASCSRMVRARGPCARRRPNSRLGTAMRGGYLKSGRARADRAVYRRVEVRLVEAEAERHAFHQRVPDARHRVDVLEDGLAKPGMSPGRDWRPCSGVPRRPSDDRRRARRRSRGLLSDPVCRAVNSPPIGNSRARRARRAPCGWPASARAAARRRRGSAPRGGQGASPTRHGR